jgi:hypothetical protein
MKLRAAKARRREEKTRRKSDLGKPLPLPVLRERAGVRVISSTRARYFQITLTPTLSRRTGRGSTSAKALTSSNLSETSEK